MQREARRGGFWGLFCYVTGSPTRLAALAYPLPARGEGIRIT